MKPMRLLRYSTLSLMILISLSGFGNDQDDKKKYVEKSYRVSSNTRLRIENKFGKVAINSWSKSEFSVKVEIVGRGRSEERAQRILDAIDIQISESNTEIHFETEIGDNKSKNEEGFEVNYTVYMPESNPLAIKNSFGDVTMGNRAGALDLDVSYGSMKVGDVQGKTNIKLSFGNGSVGRTGEGNYLVKYSKLEVESGTKMDIEQGFSDMELEEVTELMLVSKYGKIEIGKAEEIDGEAHFSGFEIEELTGSLVLECSYLGTFEIEKLSKSFSRVDIEGKFGSYEIGLAPGLAADIEAEFSFAELKMSSDVDATFHYKVRESNKSIYRGKIGAGDPSKTIKIESGYGDLRLRMD